MRISDWSSDVCSSDLRRCARADGGAGREDAGVSALAVRLDWSDLDDAQRAAALARPTRTVSRELREGVAAILDQVRARGDAALRERSEEHTSELQSLMRISYAVFCLKKKTPDYPKQTTNPQTHTSKSS